MEGKQSKELLKSIARTNLLLEEQLKYLVKISELIDCLAFGSLEAREKLSAMLREVSELSNKKLIDSLSAVEQVLADRFPEKK